MLSKLLALFKSPKRLENIDFILARHEGGVLKRLDENRELLMLLQKECPDFLTTHEWVKGLIHSQDQFLIELAKVGPEDHFFPEDKRRPFPRPWPGHESTQIAQ